MQLAIQHNMEVYKKIGFSFLFFLIFLFYVIKEKAAPELEGVLVSGCEFACMLCVG
jgi:hypothetical protein